MLGLVELIGGSKSNYRLRSKAAESHSFCICCWVRNCECFDANDKSTSYFLSSTKRSIAWISSNSGWLFLLVRISFLVSTAGFTSNGNYSDILYWLVAWRSNGPVADKTSCVSAATPCLVGSCGITKSTSFLGDGHPAGRIVVCRPPRWLLVGLL